MKVKMIKKLMLAIAIPAAIIAGLYGYVFYQAFKLPDNNPGWLLRNREAFAEKKIIVCVGDSITHGRISANYVDMLSENLEPKGFVVVNAGVNAEYSYNVLQRIDEIIKIKSDIVTILIGTNDVNGTLMSDYQVRQAMKSMELSQKPTAQWYQENLRGIVKKLKKETRARIVLVSLPPIGEELESRAYGQTVLFSKIIKEVARSEEVAYLPLNEKITAYLQQAGHKPALSYDNGFLLVMYEGAFLHTLFGKSFDDLSARNGFLIVTDFLHLNRKGAGMIAELIEGFVRGKPARP